MSDWLGFDFEGEEPPLPGLWARARNAVHDAAAVAAGALSGRGLRADAATVAARLAVCQRAEGLSPDQTTDGRCDRYRVSDARCGGDGCSCFVEIKAEAQALNCPLGRWPV